MTHSNFPELRLLSVRGGEASAADRLDRSQSRNLVKEGGDGEFVERKMKNLLSTPTPVMKITNGEKKTESAWINETSVG